MTQQIINVGNAPNDGDGDPIRTAFIKSNDNFTQLYQRVQTTPPTSFYGKVGDQAGMYAYDPTYFYYCFANYDAVTPIWAEIAQVGNISATSIAYGNSNVSITSSGSNVTIGVNGISNIATFTPQGLMVSNAITGNSLTISADISAVGNISGTYFLGNGSQLSGLPQNYGNANVESFLPTYSGTLAPSAIYTNNYFYANGAPFGGGGGGGTNYTNANVAAFLPTYTGNLGGTLISGVQTNIVTVGNLTGLTVNGLSAVNITPVATSVTIAPTFGGGISIVSSSPGAMNNMVIGNTNAQSAKFTTVSASGNVTGAYFIGDGSQLTNLPNTSSGTNYTNANVAAFLPTYTGVITAGSISVTGTVTASQLNGLVNNVNTTYGQWDFGYVVANTYTNPTQWIFAQTSLGNIDMGTVAAPASYEIDIGTIF